MISFVRKLFYPADKRSYRRKLQDRLLSQNSNLMTGVVVDLGGKNTKHRGIFRPPAAGIVRRIVVNLDPTVEPDVVADIRETGLDDGIADCVILAETLEHVPEPECCISEARRLLRSGGVFIGSVPFLYPVHHDPVDLIRIGPDGLEQLLAEFDEVKIYSMGNFLGVLGMFLERKISGVRLGPVSSALGATKIVRALLILSSRILIFLDRDPVSLNKKSTLFTTGYFFTCTKP